MGLVFNLSKCNINALRTVLIDEKIQIVINQWGLPFIPAYVLKKGFERNTCKNNSSIS